MKGSTDKPVIGVALGSGASRGWSHVGVLKALLYEGIVPDVVCGTSVGAMVGGAYLAGNLEALEDWVLASSRADVLGFFSIRQPQTAFVDIDRFNRFLHRFVAAPDVRIELLPKPFAAVCTNLESGQEVWLQEGSLAEAVKASMAMPGLFPAVCNSDRWLVDGGLVNPVPVSTCRALGAEVVIGVNLNGDILTRKNYVRKPVKERPAAPAESADTVLGNLRKQARDVSSSLFSKEEDADKAPGLFVTISKSINIFQDHLTRRRLETDPADILIAPRVGDIGMLDFQRAAEAIREGESQVQNAMPEISKCIAAR